MDNQQDIAPYDIDERSDGWAIVHKRTREVVLYEGKEMRGMSKRDANVMALSLKNGGYNEPSIRFH